METRSFNRDFSKENKPGRLIETGHFFVTRHKIEMHLVKPGRLIEQDA